MPPLEGALFRFSWCSAGSPVFPEADVSSGDEFMRKRTRRAVVVDVLFVGASFVVNDDVDDDVWDVPLCLF
jgi:hypothetical protein